MLKPNLKSTQFQFNSKDKLSQSKNNTKTKLLLFNNNTKLKLALYKLKFPPLKAVAKEFHLEHPVQLEIPTLSRTVSPPNQRAVEVQAPLNQAPLIPDPMEAHLRAHPPLTKDIKAEERKSFF